MLATGIAITAVTAAKWLVVGKILTIVGGSMVTISQFVENKKRRKE